MHTMRWEKICYEIYNYKSKLSQIKVPLFYFFCGLYEFNFLEIYIYVNKSDITDTW